MLHLSYKDLQGMALQLLADYYGTKELPFRPFDPLDFATNYMKLTVRYENLNYNLRVILGCIAYLTHQMEPTMMVKVETAMHLDNTIRFHIDSFLLKHN